jgi:hypothetical protein
MNCSISKMSGRGQRLPTVSPRCRVTRTGDATIEIVAASPDVDRHAVDKEVAFAAGLLIRGREAVVLDFRAPERAIKLRLDHVQENAPSKKATQ